MAQPECGVRSLRRVRGSFGELRRQTCGVKKVVSPALYRASNPYGPFFGTISTAESATGPSPVSMIPTATSVPRMSCSTTTSSQ